MRHARPLPQQGFTLVELMVVLAIMGLAASVVVLTLARDDGTTVKIATRLAARAALARDKSVISGASHRLWISPAGYGFDVLRAGQWQQADDHALPVTNWPNGTQVAVNGAAQGRVQFDRIGMPASPMRVTVGRDAARTTIIIAPTGAISVQ